MTPVAQKFLITSSDGTVHTGVDLALATPLTRVTGLPTSVGQFHVHWGYDKFVAIAMTNPEYIYYSSDGAAWSRVAFTTTQINYINANFGNCVRLFYAGGWWFGTMNGGLMVSRDGVSWVPYIFGKGSPGGTVVAANQTTDLAYRPETATWFANCSNGDIVYCTGKDPSVTGSWVRKAGAIPVSVWSMAYGFDQTQGKNVFIAAGVDQCPYRSLDGYNWTKGVGTFPTASIQIRYIRTNDPTNPNAWFSLGSQGTTAIHVGITSSPYASAFNTGYVMGFAGDAGDVVWDDVNFAVVGSRVSGTSTTAGMQHIREAYAGGTFSGTIPGGSFPQTSPNYVKSIAVYLPELAPTAVTPVAGATVTTPGPVLGATLSRTNGTDFQAVQWQIDTVSTFDSPNVRTVASPVIAGYSGAQTFTLPVSQALTQNGTYYLRARSITYDGPLSPWSPTQSFTANIPPVPAPTALTATNLTDYWPTFGATLNAYAANTSKLEFQFATDAAFTNIFTSFMQPDTNLVATATPNPSPFKSSDLNVVFATGTYYVRARQWSVYGLYSPWSAGTAFTTNSALPVISGITVVSAPYPVGSKLITSPTGVIATSYPTVSWLAATSTNMTTYPRSIHMQIQTASDSGFTTNLTSVDDVPTLSAGKNGGSVKIPTRLPPGVVYARGQLVDLFGLRSTVFTDTGTFSIAHPPATLPVTPLNGTLVNYDLNGQIFTWTFNDTSAGDSQTAFELLLTRASDGSVFYDSGKIASTNNSYQVVLDPAIKGVVLAWQIRTWDTDDTVGPYSKSQTVNFLDPPAVTITAPANASTVTIGRPPVTWTLAGTAPQKTFKVTITDATTNKIVWTATGTTAQTVTPPQNILDNTHAYVVKVDIVTTLATVATASNTFTASYLPPASPVYTINPGVYDQFGYILVDWSGTVPDPYFFTWTVWRRVTGQSIWSQLYVTANPRTTNYQDWSAVTGIYYDYIVSQDADRSGFLLGSSLSTPNDSVVASSAGWWFLDPTNSANNLYVNVTADSWTDEYEENTFTIVGRGRAKDVGTHLGLTGSLTATIRPSLGLTARERFASLRALRKQNKRIVLRDPFGNYYNVTIGNLQIAHVAGTGSNEMYDVTIPVDEVII